MSRVDGLRRAAHSIRRCPVCLRWIRTSNLGRHVDAKHAAVRDAMERPFLDQYGPEPLAPWQAEDR